MSYEHGRVLDVQVVKFGSELSADTAAGATSLVVEDAADFDESGGVLVINDQIIAYSACDDDTGTIALSAALIADADEGDRVNAYNVTIQAITTEKVAFVRVDGDHDDEDPVEAIVAHYLVDKLDEGIRGDVGESVLMELDGDGWRVVDILGVGDPLDGLGDKFYEDQMVASATGDQTLALTFEPKEHSEHLYWNGVYQSGSHWSRDGQIVTILDPDGIIEPGDELVMEYAYVRGIANPNDIPFGSAGWKFLQVSEGDSTDRSASGYDDSAFTQGRFPISDTTDAHPIADWLPPAAALWAEHTALWARRSLNGRPGRRLTLTIRVDDYLDGVWWNGALVHGPEASSTPYGERTVVIDGADVNAMNVLALKCRDSAESIEGDRTYIDIRVVEG